MRVSVDPSLRKLRTSYIDILYVHWWDYETGVKEVMNSLHTLVLSGKVLYLVRPFSAVHQSSFTHNCAEHLRIGFPGNLGKLVSVTTVARNY
jgi:aryl-alcohol dehydrogenase-like predicted oxidoreductase